MPFREVIQYLFRRCPRTVGSLPNMCDPQILRNYSANYDLDTDEDLLGEAVCSQHTLAAALGVSVRTIGDAYTKNRISDPNAAKLATLYRIPAEFFLGERSVGELEEHLNLLLAKERPVVSWHQVSRTVDNRFHAFVELDKRFDRGGPGIVPMFGDRADEPKGRHGTPQMANHISPCLRLRIADDFPEYHLREGKPSLSALVILEGPRGEQIVANDPASQSRDRTVIAPYPVASPHRLPPARAWFWHGGDELGGGKWTFFVLLSAEPLEPELLTIRNTPLAEGHITDEDLDRIATWAAARRGRTVLFAHAACVVVAP